MNDYIAQNVIFMMFWKRIWPSYAITMTFWKLIRFRHANFLVLKFWCSFSMFNTYWHISCKCCVWYISDMDIILALKCPHFIGVLQHNYLIVNNLLITTNEGFVSSWRGTWTSCNKYQSFCLFSWRFPIITFCSLFLWPIQDLSENWSPYNPSLQFAPKSYHKKRSFTVFSSLPF